MFLDLECQQVQKQVNKANLIRQDSNPSQLTYHGLQSYSVQLRG